MTPTSIEREAVVEQLERVLGSETFRRSERSSALLRFVVERTLDGAADQLKEYTVGVEALGRGGSFDPRVDPVVRAEASRLRDRLERYYDSDGRADPILLTLPKGSYVPRFESRVAHESMAPTAAGAIHAEGKAAAVHQRGKLSRRIVWLPIGAILVAAAIVAAVWLRSSTTPASVAPVA